LSNRSFSKSERLSSFLTYVVAETLRGGSGSLKESVLARELYDKDLDFDTASDPVVRIDARRLRDKLREYYSEFADDPVLIAVPKGGYAPTFEWNPDAAERLPEPVPLRPEVAPIAQRHSYSRPWLIGLASVLSVGIVIWAARLIWRHPEAPVSVAVPLTAYAGSEIAPSLSPDGQFVAFGWTGTETPSVQHIYIKDVHGEAMRQLTNHPASERNPAWSPDGSRIAFIRGRQGVFVISPLGGPERKISDTGTHVGWASDSKSVLIREASTGGAQEINSFGIYQVSLDTLEKRRITQPTAGMGDWLFSVSPDGKTIAFARYTVPGVADVFVAPMSGGEPRRVTNWSGSTISVAWTPDGREIVYCVQEPQGGRLWRIPWNVTTPGKGTPVAGQSGDASLLSISRASPGHPARLAYQVQYRDVGLRLVDLTTTVNGLLTSVKPLADSTRMETVAAFSPDGNRVAFASNRSGSQEVWIANRDGSDIRQLTSVGGPHTLPTTWSPDGRKLLLEATIDGHTDVYVIAPDGGRLQRLTSDPFLHTYPTWSRDGKSIYFASDRSTQSAPRYLAQIWKMPAEGGEAIQLTRTGGFFQQESPDGAFLYFLDPKDTSTLQGNLMRMPVGGGEPEKVLEDLRGTLWAVTPKGIFFRARAGREDVVNLFHFGDRRVERVGRLPFPISQLGAGWAVSEDGHWLLANQTNRNDTDLMLIDNFQ
jgi:Tol biopolymer transport system component